MRLTKHTDYALRVLLYLGAWPERLVSTEEISDAYDISNNHLVKIIGNLGKHGILDVKRGRQGGIRLAQRPEDINIGQLVRLTEPDFYVTECFDKGGNTCPIMSSCSLIRPLHEARDAFLAVLDRYTLADLLGPRHLAKLRTSFEVLAS
jgi:Rrf2 family transcriptional regulator, nitric oxide-sensitive transcriptional repressor